MLKFGKIARPSPVVNLWEVKNVGFLCGWDLCLRVCLRDVSTNGRFPFAEVRLYNRTCISSEQYYLLFTSHLVTATGHTPIQRLSMTLRADVFDVRSLCKVSVESSKVR